jgi:RimK family alpha-L-glutamate ligase
LDEDFSRILTLIGENLPESKENRSKASREKLEGPISSDVSGIRYQAYVDGSFIDGSVGYGAVILDQGTVKTEISGSVNDPEAVSSRQVGGEIEAVIEVLDWCKHENISEIAIFYDFQNIEKWATGEYKTNTPMTRRYKKYIDECGVSITWIKVESHTGVELNDRADELAKAGAKKRAEQLSMFDSPKKALKGWIVYNGSLLTPKFMDQVKWFIRAAKDSGIELLAFRNDELGAAVIDGQLTILTEKEYIRPDFVIFWDKDVRLARQLEQMGMRLFNRSKTIYACDDKILTHQILANNQIPMPKTIASPLVYPGCRVDESLFLDKIEQVLSYPMIVKEAFGSFGAQVYMAKNREELLELRKRLISVPHLYQEYIASSHGRDCRLQVVGDEVVAAMLRTSDTDFRANISAGGKMMSFIPPKEFVDLAVKAARLVKADFAGVDILFGENDAPILCEINSNAHMKNIFDCTGVDVAGRIIGYIKKSLL